MTTNSTVRPLATIWLRLLQRPELLAAGVFAADAVVRRLRPGLVVAGALDETAHLATTLLLVGPNAGAMDDRLLAGALIGSCLIDVDHVPLVLFKLPMESAEDRPVSHSLPAPLAVVVAAAICREPARSLLLGIAGGTASHFFRDLATGGIPAGWPFSRTLRRMPYAVYAAVLAAAAVRAAMARRRAEVPKTQVAITSPERRETLSALPGHFRSTARDPHRRTGRLSLRGVAALRR